MDESESLSSLSEIIFKYELYTTLQAPKKKFEEINKIAPSKKLSIFKKNIKKFEKTPRKVRTRNICFLLPNESER